MKLKSREPLQIWIDNIIKVYSRSSEVDRADGLIWYQRANKYAYDLAGRYGKDSRTVIGVIAALSPMTGWDQNLKDTEELLRLENKAKVTTYKSNKRKALKILNGSNPLENLGKYKTLSFFKCIEGDNLEICIDRHAAAIAYGRNLKEHERGNLKRVLYERLQNAYRKASSILNLRPCDLQAITWVHWRKTNKTNLF